MHQFRTSCPSPIGPLAIEGSDTAVHRITFRPKGFVVRGKAPAVLRRCATELKEYFKGARRDFTVPLYFGGTAFQASVWQALTRIPYGEMVSYKQIAEAVDRPRAFRAVGGANNKNPLPIIVPCHRVVGSDGKMVGYGSGIWRKEWLLAHEKRYR
jgi:methylated-DNA-[protein]-cysteine S-methyltransferase